MSSNKGKEKAGNEEALLSRAVEALTLSGKTADGEELGDGKMDVTSKKVDIDDEDLFKMPPTETCPLCLQAMPIHSEEVIYNRCCGKTICGGCLIKGTAILVTKNAARAAADPALPKLRPACAFCREDPCGREMLAGLEKRMALDDPQAFKVMAVYYALGEYGLKRDQKKAFELNLRGADLGSAEACVDVAGTYRAGVLIPCDIAKVRFYLQLGAKRGSSVARYNLGVLDFESGNPKVGAKHWVIASAAGDDQALKGLGVAYRSKYATKKQFEFALRAHQKARKDMSCFERDMHAKYNRAGKDLKALSPAEWNELCGIREEKK